mmetsp:Transcript_50377/g.80231  ORF Transcript_50377/g.80231 Transcript_50377/m.80231 type:complete len:210 (+) Transcript_50377:293-922(+)
MIRATARFTHMIRHSLQLIIALSRHHRRNLRHHHFVIHLVSTLQTVLPFSRVLVQQSSRFRLVLLHQLSVDLDVSRRQDLLCSAGVLVQIQSIPIVNIRQRVAAKYPCMALTASIGAASRVFVIGIATDQCAWNAVRVVFLVQCVRAIPMRFELRHRIQYVLIRRRKHFCHFRLEFVWSAAVERGDENGAIPGSRVILYGSTVVEAFDG